VSDLRESGSIEQDADIVMLLHRESIKNPTPENEHEAEVIIGKNRNGRLANLDIDYDGDTMNFKSIAKNLPEAPK
jgi:replicative DNA helicase